MSLLDSFQANRFVYRLHAAIQCALVLLVFAAVNFIGMGQYARFDVTSNHQHTLSAETLAYLEALDQPIDVIVTLSERAESQGLREIHEDILSLLRQYEYATRDNGPNRIRIEKINVYQQARRAKELGIDRPNAIVFKAGDRRREVLVSELYALRNQEVSHFLGERVFTRSILEVTEETRTVVYFTTGHGEKRLDDVSPQNGLSQLASELENRNIQARPLDLTAAKAVPPDASLLFVAGPRARFLPQEQELLLKYLQRRSGRLAVFLEPAKPHGLEDLFFEWGLLVDDNLVVETDRNYMVGGGDLMIRRFAEHPVTEELRRLQIPLVSDRARSVRADPGRPIDDSLLVTEIMATSDESWGERRYRQDAEPVYDPAADLPPPVSIAAVSERKVDSSLGISLPGGKILAIGTADLLANRKLGASGNLYFVLNAVNWATERLARLDIPPQPIEKTMIRLSIEQLLLARYLVWLAPPALVGLLGFLLYLARRH